MTSERNTKEKGHDGIIDVFIVEKMIARFPFQTEEKILTQGRAICYNECVYEREAEF